jgi:hypothetical protein
VLKGDLIFADEEGVPRGHPQALTLVPLEYFLGCVDIPKLDLLSILQIISLISHKYRGSCVAFSISKSVEPNEELKVV